MTDHTKALANALRDMSDAIKHSDFGYEDFVIRAVNRADKALAVYDASQGDIQEEVLDVCQPGSLRLTEAATRENGEIADLLNRLRSPSGIGEPSDHAAMREAAEILAVTDYGYREICKRNDELLAVIQAQTAALSTHQQQGAESKLVKSMRARAERTRATANTLSYDSTSRPALEEIAREYEEAADALSRAPQPDAVTEKMIDAAEGFVFSLGGNASRREAVREALTAALAARGK